MKTIKLIMMAALVVMSASCQKEGKQGAAGAQGPAGPGAKTFDYTLYFNAGDTYQTYTGITGMDADDVVVTFLDDPDEAGLTGFWVQTPYINVNGVNFYAEITESGSVFLNTKEAGSNISPWAESHYFNCRSVLIKSTQLAKNPNVDLTNYKEVAEAFGLEE